MSKFWRSRLMGAGLGAVLVITAACQDASNVAAPAASVGAADANPSIQISDLVFGSGQSKRAYRIIGTELVRADGRRIKLEPALAQRFHAIAAKAAKIEKQAAALAPVWKKAGLPSIDEAVAMRRQLRESLSSGRMRASVSSAPSADPAADVTSLQRASSVMPRTCDEVAIDIYESTVDYREHQDLLEHFTDTMYNCLAHGGDCTVSSMQVITWTIQINWDQLMLEDLAYTYGVQGCWDQQPTP